MSHQAGTSLALVLRVFRDEGPAAVRDRLIDRWQEIRRLQTLENLTIRDDRLDIDIDPPVLNVSPSPPSPKRGGSQIQMLDRLAEEKKLRTVALAYPRDGSWWMELWSESRSGIIALGAERKPADLIARAARLAGSGIIHIENLNGLPLGLIPNLEERGLVTVLSVHDFTLFCRKPHLIERATGEFCKYSRDMARCASCLADIDPGQRHSQIDYRRDGAVALEHATGVIYPSDFIRRQHEELYPRRREAQIEAVISPATVRPAPPSRRRRARSRIAFVGGAHLHKGGALIGPTMERVLEHNPGVAGFVYGSGDGPLTRQLRRTKGVRVRGYYVQGGLPRLLAHDGIAVSVLPSIWPEAYGLVVDESLSVGVPVVAFDHGAVADRIGDSGTGRPVPFQHGADGLARAVLEILANTAGMPSKVMEGLPTSHRAARRHIELYSTLTAGN